MDWMANIYRIHGMSAMAVKGWIGGMDSRDGQDGWSNNMPSPVSALNLIQKQDWVALMSKPIAIFSKIWLVWLDWS